MMWMRPVVKWPGMMNNGSMMNNWAVMNNVGCGTSVTAIDVSCGCIVITLTATRTA